MPALSQDESQLAQFLRDDFSNFQNTIMPLLQDQLGSLDDNSIVTQALEDNASRAGRLEETSRQDTARFGLGMSPAQRRSRSRLMKLNTTATSAGNINNARLAQQDRNENVALNLAGQGSTLRGQGMSNMLTSVGLGGARNRNNAAAAANARAQNMGTALGLATLAMSV